MINSILTNIPALKMRNNFNTTSNKLSTSLERLSSGFKINCAKDDAAGCVISRKMDTELSGLKIASQNAQHGASMLAVADKGLENMLDKLYQIRNMSLEVMNGIYSYDEKMAIQRQVDQLADEIVREKDTTMFNEKNIFGYSKTEVLDENIVNGLYAYEVEYVEATGSQGIDTGFVCNMNDNYSYTMTGDFRNNSGGWNGANAFLQLQFKDGTVGTGIGNYATLTGEDTITCSFKDKKESLTVNGQHINTRSWSTYGGSNVKIGLFRLGSNGDSWHGTSKIGGKISSYQLYKDDKLVLDLKPVVDTNGNACMFDNISKQLFYGGAGTLKSGPKIIKEPEYIEDPYSVSLQIGEDAGINDSINIELGFNLSSLVCDIISDESAVETLNRVDKLIDVILDRRSKVGSAANRIEAISNLHAKEIENLSTSRSIIKDTDIAKEAASHAKTQIMQQVSTSLFSQANLLNSNLVQKLLMV